MRSSGDRRRRRSTSSPTALARLLAPILSITADEIWRFLPGTREASVHLALFPSDTERWRDADLEARWPRLLDVRAAVNLALEARASGKRSATRSRRTSWCRPLATTADLLERYAADLPMFFITSAVTVRRTADRRADRRGRARRPAKNARGAGASSPTRSPTATWPDSAAAARTRSEARLLRTSGDATPAVSTPALPASAEAAASGPPRTPSVLVAQPRRHRRRSDHQGDVRAVPAARTSSHTLVPGLIDFVHVPQRGRGVRALSTTIDHPVQVGLHDRYSPRWRSSASPTTPAISGPKSGWRAGRPLADSRRRVRQPDRSAARRATSSTSSTSTGAAGTSGRSTSPTRRLRSARFSSSSSCCW